MPFATFTIQEAKANFFDRARVRKAVDRAKRRELARAGGFVRQVARRSIRKRRAISKPGQPPSSHEGSLRRFLFFAWDSRTESVVVGPASFRGSRAPELLERGGKAEVRRITRKNGKRTVRTERADYRPRPYMRPALRTAVDSGKVAARWRNSVRGG